MRKWILLSILTIGMLFLLAGCSGCNLTNKPINNLPNLPTNTPANPPTTSSPTSTITAGDCVATNTDGAETVAIAGATFKMGSLPADPGAKADEQPQHEVTLSCYNIYKNEVTNAMFNKCVADGACVPVQARDGNPTTHINDPAFTDYPVTGVDFNMASEYCAWAGGRLPTEAEWEYAARGADTLVYPWGNNDPTCSLANSKACLSPEDTEKVGLLTAGGSPFKLNDMAGNAWEWIFDWYAKDGYSKSAATNPIGPVAGFWKVVRGGGYNSIPDMLRAASRHSGDPYKPYYNVGFRCVTAPLTLLDNYTPPNPNPHELPLDGPVDDDDPDISGFQVKASVGPANCPDETGKLHFAVTILPHPDVTLISFNVDDGANYTCTWDDSSLVYQCVGPDSLNLNPNYSVNFCTHIDGEADHCFEGWQIPRAQNCDSTKYPLNIEYLLGCPRDGFINVTFFSNPTVTWDTTEIDGGVAMSCVQSANQLVCMAADTPPGGPYLFHLKGKDASNVPYEAWIDANPNPNCPPGNKDFKGSLDAYCAENGPAATMFYNTNLPGDPILDVGGLAVVLTPAGPGMATGPLDPSLQGTTPSYAMGIDPDMLSFGTVAVPDCQKQTEGNFFMGSRCDPKTGPVLFIQYLPPSQTVASLSINGVDTPWVPDTPGGNTMTYTLPPALWGNLLSVKMCLGDTSNCIVQEIMAAESCSGVSLVAGALCEKENPIFDLVILSGSQTLQAMKINGADYDITMCNNLGTGHYHCPLPTALEGWTFTVEVEVDGKWSSDVYFVDHCTPQTSCVCRITKPDCLSTSAIGFNVDTCVEKPVGLVAQSVTANDGTNNYDCQLTGVTGQAYCGGSLPATSGPLTVCFVQQGSQAQQCCNFPNFASSIPDCAFVPEPGGRDSCSKYTDAPACDKAGCRWNVDHCQSK